MLYILQYLPISFLNHIFLNLSSNIISFFVKMYSLEVPLNVEKVSGSFMKGSFANYTILG